MPTVYVVEVPKIPVGTRLHGHHLKGLFYRLIKPGAPDAHDRSPKGFSTAVLPPPNRRTHPSLRLRFAITDPEIEEAFLDMMRGSYPAPSLTLAGYDFEVSEMRLEPVPHHAQLTTLLESAKPHQDIRLAFQTPTAFREQLPPEALALSRSDRAVLWPEPRRMFGSFLSAWRAVPDSPPLLPALDRLIQCGIAVSQHDLRSVGAAHSKRGGRQGNRTRGFMGWCEYTLMTRSEELQRQVNTLADFATFCGSGVYRTEGMGHVERVHR